jgi:asparagine synthase (glutamine-hydrolysing)
MCGIAGILAERLPDGTVERMTRALAHRGPDDNGYFSDGPVRMGFRRLSIIDLETGQQPMSNETGDLTLVCNGTIYNSPVLRPQLQKRGHRFRSASDVEVVLHLYEEYGVDCVEHLQGMFAFALWDKSCRRLVLARDHMGQKPLFFSERDGRFLFASEVKGILASGLIEPEVDLDALWHSMSLRFLPDRHSLFRGICKVPAGTVMVHEKGRLRSHCYWRPDFRSKLPDDELSIEEGLDQLLRETVRSHLLSDVRIGSFLSGGIDSSTITALLAEQSADAVPSFSIGVEDQGFDELPYSRMVAEHCGLEAHEKVVSADLVQLLPSMIHHLDEPSDPFAVGVYLVASHAAPFVKVALTGDGGDESFAGYDRYAGQRLVDLYCLLPAWARRTFIKRLFDAVPESFIYKSLAQRLRWLHEMSFHDQGRRYAHSMSFLRFTDDARASLWTAAAQQQIEDGDSAAKILEHFEADRVTELVDRMLYTDLMTRIPDQLLSTVDRMTMAHSLEARAPLVDVRVVEFAASIPGHLKLKGRRLKHILKRVATRHLPRALVDRPKQGFGFPLATWMLADLAPLLEQLFRESRFVALGLFDPDYIARLLAEHRSGKVDHNYRLWILVNVELWYRMYFESQSEEATRESIRRTLRNTADRS